MSFRFNPPPNWPTPPGFVPEIGWRPDPKWPRPPDGWQFWVRDPPSRHPWGAPKFYLEKRVRYFQYLSRSKVKMLYEQIDRRIRDRIAVSLKINLQVIEVEGRQRDVETNDSDMLKIVLSHLDENDSIGTVDEPRAFFAGQLPLSWASWSADRFVYLGGRTSRTILGLGGSVHHLTSRLNTAIPPVTEASSEPGLENHLREVLSQDVTEVDDNYSNDIVQWASRASALHRGHPTPMEFVARLLARGEASIREENWAVRSDFEDLRNFMSVPIVVGSPLYIADVN